MMISKEAIANELDVTIGAINTYLIGMGIKLKDDMINDSLASHIRTYIRTYIKGGKPIPQNWVINQKKELQLPSEKRQIPQDQKQNKNQVNPIPNGNKHDTTTKENSVDSKEIHQEVYALKEPIKATCPECGKTDVLICTNCGYCAKCHNHKHCTDLTPKERADIENAKLQAMSGLIRR